MREFTRISLACMILAWIASMLTHSVWSIIVYGSLKGGDTLVVSFWSLIFVLLSFPIFIWMPKKWIIRVADNLNLIPFTILLMFYALIAFTILIGWGFLATNTFSGVFLDAATVGVVFGISFWHIRRNQLKKEKCD